MARTSLLNLLRSGTAALLLALALPSVVRADDLDIYFDPVTLPLQAPIAVLALDLNLTNPDTVVCDNVLLDTTADCTEIRKRVTLIDVFTLLGAPESLLSAPANILLGIGPTVLLSDLDTTARTILASQISAVVSIALSLDNQQLYVLAVQQIVRALADTRLAIVLNHDNRGAGTGVCAFADLASLPALRQDTVACSNGAYFFSGLVDLGDPVELSLTLAKISTALLPSAVAVPTAPSPFSANHPYQTKEIYTELVKYLRGDPIFNGHLGIFDYGDTNDADNLNTSFPLLSWDAGAEAVGNTSYRQGLADYPQACTINLVHLQLGNATGQDDSDAELRAQYPNSDRDRDGTLTLSEVVSAAQDDGFEYGNNDRRFIQSRFVVQENLFTNGDLSELDKINQLGGNVTTYSNVLGLLGRGTDLASSLLKSLSVDTSLGSLAIAASRNSSTGILESAYLPVFRADPNQKPDWPGNLKRLTLRPRTNSSLYDVVDARDTGSGTVVPALTAAGRIRSTALTLWTDATALGTGTSNDGQVADLGGAGQNIPGHVFGGGGDPGRSNGTGTRQLFYDSQLDTGNRLCATLTSCGRLHPDDSGVRGELLAATGATAYTSSAGTCAAQCGTTSLNCLAVCSSTKTTSDVACNLAYDLCSGGALGCGSSNSSCLATASSNNSSCRSLASTTNAVCRTSASTANTSCVASADAAHASCVTVPTATYTTCLAAAATVNTADKASCATTFTTATAACTASNTTCTTLCLGNASCIASCNATQTSCNTTASNNKTSCDASADATQASSNASCASALAGSTASCDATRDSAIASCASTLNASNTSCDSALASSNGNCDTVLSTENDACAASLAACNSNCTDTQTTCLAASTSALNSCNTGCNSAFTGCTSLCPADNSRNADTITRELLLHARGFNVGTRASPEGTGPLSSPTNTGVGSRAWMLGAVLHSRPLAINYGRRNGSTNPEDVRVVFGSADGMLHMVSDATGVESWGFMPQAVMGALTTLRENSSGAALPYGVDGSPLVIIRDRSGSSLSSAGDGIISSASSVHDRVLLVFGLRRGGSAYYALNITDPDNPQLLWRLSTAGLWQAGQATVVSGSAAQFESLGLAFSNPQVARVRVDADGESSTTNDLTTHTALLFGGGYNGGRNGAGSKIGKDLNNSRATTPVSMVGVNDGSGSSDRGNALFMIDAATGELLWRAVRTSDTAASYTAASLSYAHPLLEDSIPSDVTALDTDNDGFTDRLYVGDTGGRLWRADFPGAYRSSWTLTPVASVGRHNSGADDLVNDRRIFFAPDYVPLRNATNLQGSDVVLFGTGDREDPLNLTTQNWFYGFRDTDVISGKASSEIIVSNAAIPKHSDFADYSNSSVVDITAQTTGYRFAFTRSGEKHFSAPVTVGGTVTFSSYVPPDPSATDNRVCTPEEGASRLYSIGVRKAEFRRVLTDSAGRDVPLATGLAGEVNALNGTNQAAGGQVFTVPAKDTYRASWRERLGETK